VFDDFTEEADEVFTIVTKAEAQAWLEREGTTDADHSARKD
jgi:hypothetical protein